MDDEWTKVFTTQELFKAKVLEAKLKENDIECYIMNKPDSAYVMIGRIEIYTKEADVEQAKVLIEGIDNQQN